MTWILIQIKWAIYFSIITLLWMVGERIVGLHTTFIDQHMYWTNLFAIPAIWVMVLALKDSKKTLYNNSMSYVQGLLCGSVLSVLIAVLGPLTQWIISYVITPDYFDNAIIRSVELGYYPSVELAKEYFNYESFAIGFSSFAIIFGIATTIVAMIFLKSKQS